jgi:DNA-binding LytR/AlgR family response regulator
MKLKVVPNPKLEEPIVTLEGDPNQASFQKIQAVIQAGLLYVIGQQKGRQFKIPLFDIFYLESQENQTILYTQSDSFVIEQRLYEIETWGDPFVRINKSTVINIQKLASFKPLLNSKLEAQLANGDRVEVSRLYLPILKKKLGVNNE